MWSPNYSITCRLIRVTSFYGKSNFSLFQIEIRWKKRSKHLICRHPAPILKKQKFLPKISRNLKNNVTLIITRKLSFKIVNLKKLARTAAKTVARISKIRAKFSSTFKSTFLFISNKFIFIKNQKKTLQLSWSELWSWFRTHLTDGAHRSI